MNRMKYLCITMFLLLILPTLSNAGCIPVKQAQIILKRLNYLPDAADGILGTATGKAISTFQVDNDMPPTGTLNQPTCEKLLAEKKKLLAEKKKRQKAKEKKSKEAAILQIQKRLTFLNYYNGPLNGIKSPDTRRALIGFQKKNNLNPNGILDRNTYNKLFSADAKPAEPGLKTGPPEKDTQADVVKEQNSYKNMVGLVADYTPMKFLTEEMNFSLVGLKYNFFKPGIGFIYCEVLTGKSSDTFYYGSTDVKQVDGGSVYKLRGGYSYPFFGGSGGFDIVAGGGIEYLDMSLDLKSGGSSDITKTCGYADAGAVYMGEKFMTDLKFRMVIGDDDPDYKYGIAFSVGMRF